MEKMLAASADALLKMIEEPPENTVIIMIVERPESLLPTIQSRAQKVRFHRITEGEVTKYLTANHELPEKKARLVARICQGSLGRALEMIESSEEEDGSQRAVGFLLFKALLTEPAPSVVTHLTDLLNARDRGQAEELLDLWQSLIRDCVAYAVSGDEDEIVNIDFAAELSKLAHHLADPQRAFSMINGIKMTLADLRRNVHIQGALVALALRLKSKLPIIRGGGRRVAADG